MSAQGVQPPVLPPPGPAGLAIMENERLKQLQEILRMGMGTGQQPGPELEQHAEALDVEAIEKQLPPQPPPQYGELPGLGYLFTKAPEERQKTLVQTTPEFVRASILRAIEVSAMNSMLPFSEQTPAEHAKAVLAFAQAYLLLDPSVDQSGVPIGAEADAQGAAQAHAAEAQAVAQEGLESHKANLKAHVAAHASGQDWNLPTTKAGHPLPPKLLMNPAEKAVAEENKPKSEELRGTRGDLPRPQPRVNG